MRDDRLTAGKIRRLTEEALASQKSNSWKIGKVKGIIITPTRLKQEKRKYINERNNRNKASLYK